MRHFKNFFAIVMVLFHPASELALASPQVSASRAADESFENASARAQEEFESRGGSLFPGVTPWSAAKRAVDADLSDVPAWGGVGEVRTAFETVRDERFLPSPHDRRFLRRDPWLYPDDGCFARAQSAMQQLDGNPRPRPAKLFIFGNLSFRTRYSPQGRVYWWYHVVPAVRADGETYVMDPAIEPNRTLLLREWILRMVNDPAQARISVCDSNAYDPYTACRGGTLENARRRASQDVPRFLSEEWFRVQSLGLDPLRILGNEPPWQN
jgi:hypothetical protein